MYHICLLILVGIRSATALLQHGAPFLSPLKTFRPYFQVPLKVLLYNPAHKQLTHSVWPPSDCPGRRFMLNAGQPVRVINFCIIIIITNKLFTHLLHFA